MVRIPMAVNDSIAPSSPSNSEGLMVDWSVKNVRPMVLIAPNMRAAQLPSESRNHRFASISLPCRGPMLARLLMSLGVYFRQAERNGSGLVLVLKISPLLAQRRRRTALDA